MISSTYLLSFLFKKEASAQNIIILLNFSFGALGSSAVLILRGLEEMKKVGKMMQYAFSILPSFCFDYGYSFLLNKILIYVIDYEKTWMFLTDKDLIKRTALVGRGYSNYIKYLNDLNSGVISLLEFNKHFKNL